MSKAERVLSYSLLALITGKSLASTQDDDDDDEHEHEDEDDDPVEAAKRRLRKGKGVINEEGAWCWRDGCERR
jgi:sorting nexin-9/18/33